MDTNSLTVLRDSRSPLQKAEEKVQELEQLIKEAGLEGYQSLKIKYNELIISEGLLRTQVAVKDQELKGLKETIDLRVENEVNKQCKTIKDEAERLRKENSGLRSGHIHGPEGRVKEAKKREEQAIVREEKAVKQLDIAVLSIAEKDRIIKEISQNLENTKVLLAQAETTIQMLKEHKEMLEQILLGNKSLSEKIDNISSTEETSGSCFKNEAEAVKQIPMIISVIKLPKKANGSYDGITKLSRDCGYKDVQTFKAMITKAQKNGVYKILEMYLEDELNITERIKEHVKGNTQLKDVVDIIEKHNIK